MSVMENPWGHSVHEVLQRSVVVLRRDLGDKVVWKNLHVKNKAVHHARIEYVYRLASESPYCVRLLEASGGHILTEHCALLDWFDVSEKGGFDLRNACEMGAQVAEALAFLHVRGVIHGDVKPENVFVRKDGTAALGDFDGSVTGVESHGIRSSRTPAYCAPERFDGPPSAAADVWALAVAVYSCCTGMMPLVLSRAALSRTERMRRAAVSGSIKLSAQMDAPLRGIIRGAMHADPSARPSAAQMAVQLREYLSGMQGQQA